MAIDGQTLRDARVNAGLSVRAFARLSRINHGHISQVELGYRPATPRLVAEYTRVTGVQFATNYVQAAIDAVLAELPGLDYDLAWAYALLVVIKGEDLSEKDVHDVFAFCRYLSSPYDRCIVPHPDLPPAVADLNVPYVEPLRRVARGLRRAALDGGA